MNKKKIATLLKRKRRQLGLTQRDVSDASNVSVVTVVRMEAGEGYSIDTLMSVLKVMGLSVTICDANDMLTEDIPNDPDFIELIRPLYEEYKKLKTT